MTEMQMLETLGRALIFAQKFGAPIAAINGAGKSRLRIEMESGEAFFLTIEKHEAGR